MLQFSKMMKTVTTCILVIRFSLQNKRKLCLVFTNLTIREKPRMIKPLSTLVGLGPILTTHQVGTQNATPMSIILKEGLLRPRSRISN